MLVIEYLPIITFLWNEAFGLQLIQTSYTMRNGFGNPAVGFDVFEFMCKFYAKMQEQRLAQLAKILRN